MRDPQFSTEVWSVVGERDGVVLRTSGEGEPVFVFSGLEGSGESCLHLVIPVLRAGGEGKARPVLVDYSAEEHATLDALVATMAGLVSAHRGDGPCSVWGQSFGTILAASVINALALPARRLVLVSAYTRVPAWKVWIGPVALAPVPNALYRATARTLGRLQFGPDGGNTDHEFYDSLVALPKSNLQRRARWMRRRDFSETFGALEVERTGVWLSKRDRLVAIGKQIAFFRALAAAAPASGPGRLELSLLEDTGHVVLARDAIVKARTQLTAWLWKES